MQVAEPSPDLHVTPYPRQDGQACEAGNERYTPGQVIGHPTSTYGPRVEQTARPAGVSARSAPLQARARRAVGGEAGR